MLPDAVQWSGMLCGAVLGAGVHRALGPAAMWVAVGAVPVLAGVAWDRRRAE